MTNDNFFVPGRVVEFWMQNGRRRVILALNFPVVLFSDGTSMIESDVPREFFVDIVYKRFPCLIEVGRVLRGDNLFQVSYEEVVPGEVLLFFPQLDQVELFTVAMKDGYNRTVIDEDGNSYLLNGSVYRTGYKKAEGEYGLSEEGQKMINKIFPRDI